MAKDKAISPYTTKLHKGNAYWMAVLSDFVYLHMEDSQRTPDKVGILTRLQALDSSFMDVVVASKNSAQGMMVEHQDYFCLAFRGTDETLDWIDNVNAIPVSHLFGEFHRGFWNSVQDVWEILFGQYQMRAREPGNQKPLFLTGHSLGGAMATIAAAILCERDIPFSSCYTFGQPRAMSKATARLFNVECHNRFYRFHNNNDIVTRVPARLMGYSHVGQYFYISEEKEIHPEPGFWFRFIDYLDGAVSALKDKGIDLVEDHAMAHYLSAIEKWDYKN
ncbi:lipase family protein [Pseudoalteromonas sp. SSDWG2]|uniref:lipase family protein n=1 Tax=Pseudoalteromonas sp. SSDWG2 TaxID=3139391 RepID=UPI003BAA663B